MASARTLSMLLAASAIVLLGLGCGEPRSVPVVNIPTADELSPSVGDNDRSSTLVALETRPEAILGSISRVRIVESTEDIWIGDFDSARALIRFSKAGTWRDTISADSIGELKGAQVADFALLDDARLVVVYDQYLAVLDPSGRVARRMKLDYVPGAVEVLADRIYVRALRTERTNGVTVYDKQLRELNTFHRFDERAARYTYAPMFGMTTVGRSIWVSAMYSPRLHQYSPDGDEIQIWSLGEGGEIEELADELWQSEMTEVDRRAIRAAVHRYDWLFGVGTHLFLVEQHLGEGVMRSRLLLPSQLRAVSLESEIAIGRSSLDGVVGRAGNSLIAFSDDPGIIRSWSGKQQGVDVTHRVREDNPTLIFIELDRPKASAQHAHSRGGAGEPEP